MKKIVLLITTMILLMSLSTRLSLIEVKIFRLDPILLNQDQMKLNIKSVTSIKMATRGILMTFLF